MDNDDAELVRGLFAKATAMLEDAAVVAAKGQSAGLDAERLSEAAQRLVALARDVKALARAALAIADGEAEDG